MAEKQKGDWPHRDEITWSDRKLEGLRARLALTFLWELTRFLGELTNPAEDGDPMT